MNGNLRSITDTDLKNLLRWRNHPRVRKAMITKHRISWEEHLAWWEKTRSDETKQWHIYQENDEPMAVASFFRLDAREKTGWWGFYLCDYSEQSAAGRASLARRVIQNIIRHAAEELKLRRLLCEVFRDNLPARRLYHEQGFRESNIPPSTNDVDLLVMELPLPHLRR